jgi:molybdopterin converting factor small subunit
MNIRKKVVATTLGAVFALASFSSVFAAEAPAQSNEPAWKAHFAKHHKMNLEELAKQKGITVDELKAQFKKNHRDRGAKLEELAKQKGITVEELKAQFKQKHEAKLEELAKQKGITVDELKAQFKQKHEGTL